ncbi:class II aldolase/adducin family protein [Sneathiella marina]|uniref:Class II aldolase/adducin family protein n=1 Tax=Sneathiella marina TaxID=2950108 RepID=A0ABY4VYL3_9PROT|nr:class II aldolase/adducin family protein [Sneathiella marina]USG59913.1 class II aldolase/adducin family protein [Sneathiella marina]
MGIQQAIRINSMSLDEWQARVDLAACYRLIAHFGMDDLIYTHISARIPGPEDHFLLNPFGLLYEEVTASNLVKVDLNGTIIDPAEEEINPAGFIIHSCVHEARTDIACVIHTHTVAGVGVAAQSEGLLPLSQTALLYTGLIGYHEYEGLALNPEEQARLLADLGDDKQILFLRNHGLLTCGRSIPEAFIMMYYIEQACRMQIAAQAGNGLHLPSKDVQDLAHAQAMTGLGAPIGSREFAALKRRLDRLGADYAR